MRLATQQLAEFDIWQHIQPEVGGHPTSHQPAEIHACGQPEPGGHLTTQLFGYAFN